MSKVAWSAWCPCWCCCCPWCCCCRGMSSSSSWKVLMPRPLARPLGWRPEVCLLNSVILTRCCCFCRNLQAATPRYPSARTMMSPPNKLLYNWMRKWAPGPGDKGAYDWLITVRFCFQGKPMLSQICQQNIFGFNLPQTHPAPTNCSSNYISFSFVTIYARLSFIYNFG